MTWRPRCESCGDPATARLVYVWDGDNRETARTRPLCRRHLDLSLGVWDRLKASTHAVDELRVLVVAA
jgi:hypothetical protein